MRARPFGTVPRRKVSALTRKCRRSPSSPRLRPRHLRQHPHSHALYGPDVGLDLLEGSGRGVAAEVDLVADEAFALFSPAPSPLSRPKSSANLVEREPTVSRSSCTSPGLHRRGPRSPRPRRGAFQGSRRSLLSTRSHDCPSSPRAQAIPSFSSSARSSTEPRPRHRPEDGSAAAEGPGAPVRAYTRTRLHHVLAPAGLQLALQQQLQQLHREVALGHAAHLGQELVRED